jgi:tRNA-splicing ligase RtcB
MDTTYETITTGGVPIKAWTKGVALEEGAREQLRKVAEMPFVGPHVAAMPDVHRGIGATVGSVIATRGAVIPAAVGVDIGCGMMAVRTSLTASQLPDDLKAVRTAIERSVPFGRTAAPRRADRGSWQSPPEVVNAAWKGLEERYRSITSKHRKIDHGATYQQLGTLGTGNHFIELCLDEEQQVWVMLHSGSRGVGNRIGTYFIELARDEMRALGVDLPDRDLSYLREGTQHFDDYVEAVSWAQDFAAQNRELMMRAVCEALRRTELFPAFEARLEAVNCHHNYISRETHFGAERLVTRKGAVRARREDLGIIPGSMGSRSFIVRGKGNDESFHSCSHGAGRMHSRTAAKKLFSLADHEAATAGVECRKDAGVIDETPAAYKPIDEVMKAQADLVEILHTLRQVVCVKG